MAAKHIVEISASNLTYNLDYWESDYAVMFYAPWCKYCNQLAPGLDIISQELASRGDLIVGKCNCEIMSNIDFCTKIGINRYPTLYFFGHGNFNQIPSKGHIFSKSLTPSMVKYDSDLYLEAIFDWIKMLSFMSWSSRAWDNLKSLFSFKNRNSNSSIKIRKLESRIEELTAQVERRKNEVSKLRANEIFDKLKNKGDPYPLMHSSKPDDSNLPLRMCVGEMAGEYCKFYADEEPHCEIIPICASRNMEPQGCRPAACPFGPRGCTVVSVCLDPGVIEQYTEALNETTT